MHQPNEMARRVSKTILLVVFLISAATISSAADEDNDGLPGARVSPTRAEIEALIRAVNRDPVTPELIDRVDAVFRPRWARPSGFEGAKARAVDPAIVAILDEIAREVTNKPADTRMIISRVHRWYNSPDRNSIRSGFREEYPRETGPRKAISGQILDEETGKPIANVVVSAAEILTRSDAKGKYVFKAREPAHGANVCISIEAPGYALTTTYFKWNELTDTETRDVRVARAVPYGGHVLDAEGKPLAGVQLELWVSGEGISRDGSMKQVGESMTTILEAKTDAQGAYAFRGVPPEIGQTQPVSRLLVKHPKYVMRTKEYTRNELLGTGWEITLEHGCEIRGVVTDGKGKPVKDASVTAMVAGNSGEDPWTNTDAEGKFQLEGLAEANFRLIVNPRDHVMKVLPVEVKQAAPLDLKISVEEGVYFTGKVIGTDGKPANNAMVGWIEQVDDKGKVIDPTLHLYRFTNTKEDGTFKVGPVAKGRYKIQALVEPPRAIADLIVETDGKELILELKPDWR
jgi:protocatechuate 3,4-dioxygenase beta subunit